MNRDFEMITIEKIEPIETAFARLRTTPLDATNGEQIFIYQTADIRLAEIHPDEVNPTSLYVLAPQLTLLREMRKQLLDDYDIDILHLSAILHLRTKDGKLFGMAPPFVEVYKETVDIIVAKPEDRTPPRLTLNIPVFKDGMHRAWIAREENETVTSIVVRGALAEHPPYSYPNEWSQVTVCQSKAERKLKKFFRRQSEYSYLRPLRALRQTGDVLPAPEYGADYR